MLKGSKAYWTVLYRKFYPHSEPDILYLYQSLIPPRPASDLKYIAIVVVGIYSVVVEITARYKQMRKMRVAAL